MLKEKIGKFKIKVSKWWGINFLLFFMIIGFAALNTDLKILGLFRLRSTGDDFNIYISNAFLNDQGISKKINSDRDLLIFSYENIRKTPISTLNYTIRNTSILYDATVEFSCKAENEDKVKFIYSDDGQSNSKLTVKAGSSATGQVNIKLPDNSDSLSDREFELDLYELMKGQSLGEISKSNFNPDKLDDGVFQTNDTDTGETVYYYRGNVNNNIVFNDKCWLIMRTTETGGIKLVYNGTYRNEMCLQYGTYTTIDNDVIAFPITESVGYDNAYAGYMYGAVGSDSYETTHANINDSKFKIKIDKWYETNFLDTKYEEYLEDSVFCNDRSILSGNGYSISDTIYNARTRADNTNPTLKCQNENDKFTVETSNGNGALKYPIGMISVDEMIYAGIRNKRGDDTWLYGNGRYIQTITPRRYQTEMHMAVQKAGESYNNNYGRLSYTLITSEYALKTAYPFIYVSPVISLKSGIKIVTGDGTLDNPYMLETEDVHKNQYTCSIKVANVGRKEIADDSNSIGIGEEYCIGKECFFVIEKTDTKISLLAKYNLYVGSIYTSETDYTSISKTDPLYGKQHSSAIGGPIGDGFPRIGTTEYASGSSISFAESTAKSYIDEYVQYLQDTYAIDCTGTLITKNQLMNLGCSSNSCSTTKYDFVTGLSYWANSDGSSNPSAYTVGADGYFGATGKTNKKNRGIRPVIEISISNLSENIPKELNDDNGIFKKYYNKAYSKLQELSTHEKVGQLLLARYPDDESAAEDALNYHLGGYVLFSKDFKNKTVNEVQNMINNVQFATDIPLITAVDEEGGQVVRISSNTNLRSAAFPSSQELYKNGGLAAIKTDTEEKIQLLRSLGLNVNLAPVLDIATNKSSYIYPRTLGQDAKTTSEYAKTIVNTSKGTGVSFTLKHFPGYGDNIDTHGNESIDTRSFEEYLNKDSVPFREAINAGAEAIMITHNIVTSIDSNNPASISPNANNFLYNTLKFTGISMTDDLNMGATNSIEGKYKKAIIAGNNMIIVSDYQAAYNEILDAVNNEISTDMLDKAVFKILAWKYYKGLLK